MKHFQIKNQQEITGLHPLKSEMPQANVTISSVHTARISKTSELLIPPFQMIWLSWRLVKYQHMLQRNYNFLGDISRSLMRRSSQCVSYLGLHGSSTFLLRQNSSIGSSIEIQGFPCKTNLKLNNK